MCLNLRLKINKDMKATILYKAIDPYYSDTKQTFIGVNADAIDNQIYEFEKYLGRNHPNGISNIYKTSFINSDEYLELKVVGKVHDIETSKI